MKAGIRSWKSKVRIAVLVFWPVVLGAQAQISYSIDWFTSDGGGGISTGGIYSVSGTIGQPDAGIMSGGNFTLEGGFWSIIAAIQEAGAPWLTVTRTVTNTVIVSWPSPAIGFSLFQNSNLGTTNWFATTNAPVQVGDEWQVTVLPPTGIRSFQFYRLRKQ